MQKQSVIKSNVAGCATDSAGNSDASTPGPSRPNSPSDESEESGIRSRSAPAGRAASPSPISYESYSPEPSR
eukprot:3333650-Karenia_brevis.AAC.1